MSLTGSLLALVMIPLKARPEPRPKEAENLAVMALAGELRRTIFALDHWRRSGNALMGENERLRAENGVLRDRLRDIAAQRDQTNPAWRRGGYEAEMALLDQAYGLCTCVPSRAQAFAADLTPGRVWRFGEGEQ